jgi:hypothetical protein
LCRYLALPTFQFVYRIVVNLDLIGKESALATTLAWMVFFMNAVYAVV